jgi:hypothetical protein
MGFHHFPIGIFQPLEMVISWDSIGQEWSSNGTGGEMAGSKTQVHQNSWVELGADPPKTWYL